MNRLEERAVDAGRAWATDVRSALVDEGRRVCGGWPGTLSEAHSRMHVLDTDSELSHVERQHLAAVLYGAAKARWLSERDAND